MVESNLMRQIYIEMKVIRGKYVNFTYTRYKETK